MTLTSELIADLRKKAEAARDRNTQPGEDAAHVVEVDPLDMLSLLDQMEALEELSKSLLEADIEANEPFWPESEDAGHECEWWPVPGAARRALWRLRQK